MEFNTQTDSNRQSLSAETIGRFTGLLWSDAPAPGGGSAAALCGSLGASLCGMVSNLTLGRTKYAEFEPLCAAVAERAEQLRVAFLDAIDLDTNAFNRFSRALALPKETDEQKAVRAETVSRALIACIDSPLTVMRLCDETIRLTESIIGKSNISASSDIGVSALCLKAAVQSAWLNVRINLPYLKDAALRDSYRTEGEKLKDSVCTHADECYQRILNSL